MVDLFVFIFVFQFRGLFGFKTFPSIMEFNCFDPYFNLRRDSTRGRVGEADVSVFCHFGSNRNDGILVQLSETSSALSVDTVHSTTRLAR